MAERITFEIVEGTLEIYLNPEGRDRLVRELQNLSESSDHFHFGPKDMGEVEVSERAYHPNGETIAWGKVLFRPDDWDARHFPHVLEP